MPVYFQGIQEGQDPKALPPGTLLLAENCAMDKPRRLGKRLGTTAIAATLGFLATLQDSSFPITTPHRLQTRGKDLALQANEHTYQRVSDGYMVTGRSPSLAITKRGLVDTTRSAGLVDIAVAGDLLFTVYGSGYSSTTGAALYFQIENLRTGTKEAGPYYVGQGMFPRVLVAPGAGPSGGDAAMVIYGENGTGKVQMFVFTPGFGFHGTFQLNALADGITDAAAGLPCDAAYCEPTVGSYVGDRVLYVAYGLQANGRSLLLLTCDFTTDTYTLQSTTTTAAAAKVQAIGVDADPVNGVAVIDSLASSATDLEIYDNDGTSTAVGFATNDAFNGWSQNVWVKFQTKGATPGIVAGRIQGSPTAAQHQAFRTDWLDLSLALSTETKRKTYHVQGISRPWAYGGKLYCGATLFPRDLSLTSTATLTAASSVILEIDTSLVTDPVPPDSDEDAPHLHVATTENQTGWIPFNKFYTSGAVAPDDDGVAYLPAAYRNREPVNIQRLPVGWELVRAEPNAGDCHRLAPIGQGGCAASGAPYWFDGRYVYPMGFVHAPMIVSTTAAAGGSMAAGTYGYIAVYEWRDANGVLHRSPASPPKSVVVTANQKVTLSITTSSLSYKTPLYPGFGLTFRSDVSIALYRTLANGSIYYRRTLEPEFAFIANDPTAGTVSYEDVKADSDIADANPVRPLNVQPQLYTATGELADVPPPAFTTIAVHRNRLAGIDANERTIWFSKDQSEDLSVAPGFNEALTVSYALPKYAIASLDEKAVVFGANDIDVIHGLGPDATGQNGSWESQRLQTDAGCTNPKSVVTTPQGVAFQSARGIEMLTRELAVTWIGKQVEDTLAAYPNITSATLCAEAHEVRWTCNAADGETGIVLAWDYMGGIWFVRRYKNAAGTASLPFVDAALVGGVYSMLDAAGIVYQETSDSHLDCGTHFVVRDVKLASMSPSGSPLMWHRIRDVYLLGTSRTKHELEVSAAHDFATSWAQVETFLETDLATTVGVNNRARVTFAHQKCQAVQLRIRDLEPDPADFGTGEGPILEGLAFRVETKGPVKLAAQEQR